MKFAPCSAALVNIVISVYIFGLLEADSDRCLYQPESRPNLSLRKEKAASESGWYIARGCARVGLYVEDSTLGSQW